MEVMIVNKTGNSYFAKKCVIGLIGEESDLNVLFNNHEKLKINENIWVRFLIRKHKELIDFFEIDSSILNKKLKDLSYCEYKIVLLIKAISLKPELIILNNFEIGFSGKYYNIIWRFLQNISLNYDIKFILLSNNFKFLNKTVKEVIVLKNKTIKFRGDLITAIKQNYLEKPEIIKFIELANLKDAKLKMTLDNKELLKDIYRSIN